MKQVSKSLLTSVPGSLLEKTFSGKHQLKKLDDHVFLDRDPRIFEMVLNYLRYDCKYFPRDVDSETRRIFEMEIHYWELGNFIEPKLPKSLIDMLKTEPNIA